MALSEGTIRNHNAQIINNVREHNKKVKESHQRSFLHELDCSMKDTKNYDFNGMQHYVCGFGEKKETLSHKIYLLQCRLNKESKIYRVIAATLRKAKNLVSSMFHKKHISGLPRIFK